MYSSGTLRIHELTPEEQSVYATLKPEGLPQHVAIIMDGNGRWAGRRSLKRFLGHQRGARSVQLVTETASRIGLPWLTLYAFSLENNLRRPRAEVSFLMRLLKSYLESNLQRMMDNNVRMRYIGRTHELPPEVQDKMRWVEETTAHNTGTTSHSGSELWRALGDWSTPFRRLAAEIRQKHIGADHITEQDIHRHLYTAHMPDPDLLIRTSGESAFRISCSGRSPMRRSLSRNACGPTSAAFTFSKPLPTSSAGNGVTAASAKIAAKSKKIPNTSRSRRADGTLAV